LGDIVYHYPSDGISHKGEDCRKSWALHINRAANQKVYHLIAVWWNYWDYCPRDEKDHLFV